MNRHDKYISKIPARSDLGENETRVAIERIKANKEKVSSIVEVTIKSFSWLCIAFLFYLSIKELAGKVTQTDIQVVTSLGDGPNSYLIVATVLSLMVGAFGIYYGERQRRFFKEQSAKFIEDKINVGKQAKVDRTRKVSSEKIKQLERGDD